MNVATTLFVVGALAFASAESAADVNPISKILQLLSDMEAKITKEGEESQKTFNEYSEWCEERNANVGFEIKTGTSEVEELTANIQKQSALHDAAGQKIEELAGSIGADEKDLKAASEIRAEEAKSFAAEDKELVEVSGTLDRAVAVLSRELNKGGASMMQLQSAKNVVQALGMMVQASALSSADASRLTALVQNSEDADDAGAPDAAVYESKSGSIVEVIQGLQDKAQEQLSALRKKEMTALHNFAMLEQSLNDEITYANKDLAATKKAQAAAS